MTEHLSTSTPSDNPTTHPEDPTATAALDELTPRDEEVERLRAAESQLAVARQENEQLRFSLETMRRWYNEHPAKEALYACIQELIRLRTPRTPPFGTPSESTIRRAIDAYGSIMSFPEEIAATLDPSPEPTLGQRIAKEAWPEP